MTFKHQMLGWEKYPITLSHTVRWVDDVYYLQEQLEKKSEALFINEPLKIKLEVFTQGVETPHNITTITSLEEFLIVPDAVAHEQTKIFIISQRNSWTRLKISFEMFKMLCHFYQVFPKYIESVFRFSVNTCRTEEYFSGGCYRHVHEGGGPGSEHTNNSAIFEISYNLRHFEEHSRNLQDPESSDRFEKYGRQQLQDLWSSRQCSVYQNYSHRNNASIWIFIQVPSRTRYHLERLNSERNDSPISDHPMCIHLHVLVSCEKNWGSYIGYLGMNCHQFQSLAYLRRKLEDARSLLKTNLGIASTLSDQAEEMQRRGVVVAEPNERFQSEVRQYKLRLQCHICNVKKHLAFSEDIRLLVFKIMDFRNDELLRVNSYSLKDVAKETASENKAMVTIAKQSLSDSRMVKITTVIATIYLPLSLVASFFSTGLVQYSENGEGANITMRNATWVFIVICVSLMACTLASVYFWARRGIKFNPFTEKLCMA
ncbi:hypothetical protein BDD12DRAFT_985012 [Trichophaea hybrida]|nr:hypothetical protein BDD12DRAFT_985012 [Trichophaea hybrida]